MAFSISARDGSTGFPFTGVGETDPADRLPYEVAG
jgi:hypothetical protein